MRLERFCPAGAADVFCTPGQDTVLSESTGRRFRLLRGCSMLLLKEEKAGRRATGGSLEVQLCKHLDSRPILVGNKKCKFIVMECSEGNEWRYK